MSNNIKMSDSPENGTYNAINNLIMSRIGDFTPFYIAVAICSVLLVCIIVLNIVFCCSGHSEYWLDRHTGNRWLVTIWVTSPHKQPSLDYSELKSQEELGIHNNEVNSEESHSQGRKNLPSTSFQQQLTSSQENLELIKRESDI